MKLQTKLMLAVAALAPVYSSALADPLPVSVNPRSIPRSPDVPRSVLVPAPATGPCRAELGLDRVEITRSADGAAYNLTVTIGNTGTEPATGVDGGISGFLGIKVDMQMEATVGGATRTQQLADIDVVHAGTNRTFSGSIPFNTHYRTITARINRGPDAPRCAYDARRSNDGLGVLGSAVRAAHAAGSATYVRVAPWAT